MICVQMMHPMYDKVKYFMHQINCLLPQSIDKVFEKWNGDSCLTLELKVATDRDVDIDHPKNMGDLKTTGLEKSTVS